MKSPKIALIIRGISYLKNYLHHSSKVFDIDCRSNLHNLFEQVINPLKLKYKIVKLYISTNSSPFDEEIKELIPEANHYLFNKNNTSQAESLHDILQYVVKDNINPADSVDFVIITRFDLDLKYIITDIPYHLDKFNFIWYEVTKDNKTGDAMHFLSFQFITHFMKAIQDCPDNKSLHDVKKYLEKYISKENMNVIFSGYIESNSDKSPNPLYTIKRGEVIADFSKKKFYKKFLGKNYLRFW